MDQPEVKKKEQTRGDASPNPKKKNTRIFKFAAIGIIAVTIAAILGYFSYSYYQHILNAENTYPKHNLTVFDIGTTDPDTLESVTGEGDQNLDEIYDAIDQSKAGNVPTVSGQAEDTTANGEDWAAYPETILPCTRDGNDLLVLVNKRYQLPSTYGPTDLVALTNSGLRSTHSGLLIRNIIVSDLTALVNAANAENIDLAALSAYRSYAAQQSTYTYWVNYNGGDTAAADMVSARPGHSQHQLGTTVDFTTNEISDQLGQHFGNTAAGKWLAAHAWEYGFALAYPSGWEAVTGYSYEPWHFRYIGKENATEWHNSGKILELWLQGKN